MISKIEAIISLVPGAEVVVRGEEVEWINPEVAPVTDAEIQAEYDRLVALEPLKQAKANRANAYKTESDPLFFKVQRGEATQDEWLAKIEEIKNRYLDPNTTEAQA